MASIHSHAATARSVSQFNNGNNDMNAGLRAFLGSASPPSVHDAVLWKFAALACG